MGKDREPFPWVNKLTKGIQKMVRVGIALGGAGLASVAATCSAGDQEEQIQNPSTPNFPPPAESFSPTPVLETPVITQEPAPTTEEPKVVEPQPTVITQQPPPTRAPSTETPQPTAEIVISEGLSLESSENLIGLINFERSKNGLSELKPDQRLEKAAQDYVQHIFEVNWPRREHANPHYLKGTPQSRADEAGYQGGASEVIGWWTVDEFTKAEGFILRSWIDRSPPHRAVVLDPAWINVGVGCYQEPQRVGKFNAFFVLCVAMFGKPNQIQTETPTATPTTSEPQPIITPRPIEY